MAAVGFFILILVIGFVWRLITAASGAGVRALTTGGNFGDQFKARAFGMGPFEVRLQRIEPTQEKPFAALEVQARGLFPVNRTASLGIVTSVFDVTDDGAALPVLSSVEAFQEAMSPAYRFDMQPATVEAGWGLPEWSRVGIVIPDILTPPRTGLRRLLVYTRLIDADNPSEFELGFVDEGGPQPFAAYHQSIDWTFDGDGYREAAERRRQRRPLFVRLAVATAMADGTFGKTEAETIRKWVSRHLAVLDGDSRDEFKEACNSALREAYAQAKAGSLSYSEICDQIVSLSDVPERYEAIELCLDVMASDGKAEASELSLIRKLAEVLEIDLDELTRMKDQRMVGLTISVADGADESSLEAALGIEADWSPEYVHEYLRDQFRIWNARLNTVAAGEERSSVQARLDLIAKARRKYAS